MVGLLEANSTGGLDCSENRDLGGGKAAHHRAIERTEVGVPLGHQIGRGKSAVPKRFPEVNSTGGLGGPESPIRLAEAGAFHVDRGATWEAEADERSDSQPASDECEAEDVCALAPQWIE